MLNAFFKNKNQAGAFSSPIILVFAAFGGSMLPLEQIPAGHALAGQIHRQQLVHHRLPADRRREDPAGLAFIVLAVSGLIFAGVAMVALQRRLST